MKYPYIGKGSESGTVVMMVKPECGLVIKSKTWATKNGKFETSIDETYITNITSEYLSNTYGEVESPEHAEFIIELCKANGISVYHDEFHVEKKFFAFNGDCKLFFFPYEVQSKISKGKQITIPPPPKAEPKIYPQDNPGKAPKHFDCVCNKCGGKCCMGQCDKQEPSELPQVGDEICWSNRNHKAIVIYLYDSYAWVKSLDGESFNTVRIDKLKKLKTPEEELRDDIESIIFKKHAELATSSHEVDIIIEMAKNSAEILLDEFEMKRKPQ